MALTLRYVGARPYTEFLVNGTMFGFSRGMEREDVPDEWIREMIIPGIENGSDGWQVEDSGTKKMIELLSTDDVKEAVVEEVVEEPVIEEAVNSDDALLEAGFEASLTRAQMMSWCAERGIRIVNTDTKDILSQKARDYVTGESE